MTSTPILMSFEIMYEYFNPDGGILVVPTEPNELGPPP
jgi:hypothetical protein